MNIDAYETVSNNSQSKTAHPWLFAPQAERVDEKKREADIDVDVGQLVTVKYQGVCLTTCPLMFRLEGAPECMPSASQRIYRHKSRHMYTVRIRIILEKST